MIEKNNAVINSVFRENIFLKIKIASVDNNTTNSNLMN